MASTRERLITATNERFRRTGYHGTSIKEVTVAAGAPTGSLYHFFPGGKQELARAVILETGAAYGRLFEMIADEAAGPAEAVRAFFDGGADMLEQTDYVEICPIGLVAREVASTEEALRQASAEVFESWCRLAANRFRAAGIEDAEAEALAATVVATVEGSLTLARACRDAEGVRAAGGHMSELVSARLPRTARRRRSALSPSP